MIERTEFEPWRSKEVARVLALVETERRYYQDLVAALPVPLAVLSSDGGFAWANRSFRSLFQLRADEVRRRTIDQLIPGQGVAGFVQAARQQPAPPPPLHVTISEQAARLSAINVHNWEDDREPETLLVLELGVSAAKQPAEEAPALVPPDLPAIVWTADGESTDFRTVSGAAEEFLGHPITHWLNRAGFFEERIHPDDREPVMSLYRSLLERGGDGSAEFRAVKASGEFIWCRESIRVASAGGAPPTMTGVLTNISRRKQFEQQLLSAARLDSIQAMAGRLAHDLNNPLMIINGYGEELVQALGPTNPLRADASEIMTAAQRISGIAGKLTDLSRTPSAPVPSRILVSELVQNLQSGLAEAAGPRVTLEMTPAPEAIWAKADAVTLGEAILALASQDRESARNRTRLTVTVGAEMVSECVEDSPLAAGQYAVITLRDDGMGLDAPKVAALFDPNVSPIKPEGIVLARLHHLIRQWGGNIACASEPNRGTIYSIFLPRIDIAQPKAPEPKPGPPAPVLLPEPVPEPEPVRETILVVDDEAGIRGLMRKILKRERYNVLEAASAEEAMQTAASHTGKIEMLLTDVMLPGMLGPELARKLYALDSSLKVLYISGYTPDEAVRAGEYPPGAKFLAKPFTLGALLEKVRETLGR